MVYYTMSRRKEGKRKVDPYRIWFFNGTFYMIGYCHQRRGIRIFAVDRIKMLHQTKESFEIPEDFDFEEFMRPSFGVFQGKGVKVKIWFAPDAAGYIKEKIWHDTQEIVHKRTAPSF
jgi:predicted DNA-binding transcriptional regulator YafY